MQYSAEKEELDLYNKVRGIKEGEEIYCTPLYITMVQSLKIIVSNINREYFYLISNNRQSISYTLNDRNIDKLSYAFDLTEIQELYESDDDIFREVKSILQGTNVPFIYSDSDYIFMNRTHFASTIKIKRIPDLSVRRVTEAGFFPYFHTSTKDLTKYQIFREDQDYESKNKENCFIYALIQSGQFSDSEIESIKLFVQTRDLSVRKVTEIAKKFDFGVSIKRRKPSGGLDVKKINTTQSRVINIGIIHDHYFLNENRSFETIEALELLGKLKKIGIHDTIKMTREYYKNQDSEILSLELKNGQNIRPYEWSLKEQKRTKIWVADFESYQGQTDHDDYKCSLKPLLLVSKHCMNVSEHGYAKKVSKTPLILQKPTKDDIKSWFKSIINSLGEYQVMDKFGEMKPKKEKAIVYFHNLKYDFIQLLDLMDSEVKIIGILPHGGSLLNARISYLGYEIEFRCSYRLMTMSIKDLAKAFLGESQQKEMLPYDLYTQETKDMESVHVEVLSEYYQGTELEAFLKLASNFISKDRFYLHSYNEYYCIRDVEILDQVLYKFQKMISEEFKMTTNALNFLTFPSLADYYMGYRGVYEGVFELSGIPQLFCSRAVVGGRCMTNSNKAFRVKKQISDEDVNSLYPAAMSQISIPIGRPEVVNSDFNMDSDSEYYIVEIEVLDIPIKREFPLLSTVNNEGVRIFSNDIRGKIIIDKITLEDCIEFQGLEYKVIRGYSWTHTSNRIQTVIRDIYNKRVELKKLNDQRELIYKLMMNSSYGKNLLKPFEKKFGIYNQQDYGTKIINSYQNINSVVPLPNNRYLIEEYNQTIEQFNRVHVGCQILSQSKRIMNKVMCLAEDIGIRVYYQDTDSMHMATKDRERLEEAYRMKYSESLFHKTDLGKLSSDFKVEDQEGEIFKDGTGTEGYYLGKKQYAVRVENDKGQVGYHMRQKGIPSGFMKYSDYHEMLNGEKIPKKLIDPENPKSVAGIRLTNMRANILKSFHRTIRCNQEKISDIV
jgi:hypothetical protein